MAKVMQICKDTMYMPCPKFSMTGDSRMQGWARQFLYIFNVVVVVVAVDGEFLQGAFVAK